MSQVIKETHVLVRELKKNKETGDCLKQRMVFYIIPWAHVVFS